MAAAFPARGIIKLLPAARTGGDRPLLDRLIAEDYILDTIFFYDSSRVDCAGRLAYGEPKSTQLKPLMSRLHTCCSHAVNKPDQLAALAVLCGSDMCCDMPSAVICGT